MALVERRDSKGRVVYWVAFYARMGAKRKQVWERSGPDRRGALALERRRKREVADGTFVTPLRPSMSFGSWLASWAAGRKGRNAKDDSRRVEMHLLTRRWLAHMPCDELRPRHASQLVAELRATVSAETGRPLSEKYVANLYGLFRSCVQEARRQELIASDPCLLPRGTLSSRVAGSAREPYTASEALALIGVSEPAAAMFAALALFTGMREGEVCGRRWRDWDPSSKPLGCLHVVSQYDDRPLKTDKHGRGEHARKVPVHPRLEAALVRWHRSGFSSWTGHPPTQTDFVLPKADGSPHTRATAYKLFRHAVELAGVKNRTLHATRHTFITLCRRGGAREDIIERITHNARGTIVDQYTHFAWNELATAVMCLSAPLDAALDGQTDPRPGASFSPIVESGPGCESRGEERDQAEASVIERNRARAPTTQTRPQVPPSAAGSCAGQETGPSPDCRGTRQQRQASGGTADGQLSLLGPEETE